MVPRKASIALRRWRLAWRDVFPPAGIPWSRLRLVGVPERINARLESLGRIPLGLRALPGSPLLLTLLGMAFLVALLTVVSLMVWMLVLSPPPIPKKPRAKAVAQTSHIYAADGSTLASVHGEINREPVPLASMAPSLWKAAVASEDERFFRHRGVDPKALLRAALADAAAGAPVQGGSTITQQYVKAAYTGEERTLVRKVREALLARRVERQLSKKEILERYLNTVYFGRGAYGVQAAADAYFGKPAGELTVSESALLIGLIPGPARFSPDRAPAAAEERRTAVIERMDAAGLVGSKAAREAVKAKPVVVPIREEATRFPWFTDAVQQYLFARYGVDKVLTGGLKVRTTLDPQVQQAAEEAVRRAVPNPQDPHAALAAVDPATGYVRAIVGGREWGPERFNIATLGRRQPGSAFKPFVLIGALEKGISPTKVYAGPRKVCLDDWTPGCVRNFGGSSFGHMDLEDATVHSVNTVYAQLVLDVGPKRVVDVAKRMGIPAPKWLVPEMPGCRPKGRPACQTHLRAMPALALGSQEVTPLEMASAYATLAAGGIYRQPKVVEEIVEGSGKVLERGPAPGKRAVGEGVAARTTQILHEAVARGTGQRADIGDNAAGKTGTAQDFRNAWFVGYTPELASAVWVGYRDSNRALRDVHGEREVTGGSIPADIWADSMTTVDVAVAEAGKQGRHLLGGEAAYRLSVANRGPWEAPEVALVDRLPGELDLVSAKSSIGECAADGGELTCDIGNLARGKEALVDVVVRPKEAGTFVHKATVSLGRDDAAPDNNAADLPVVVHPSADLKIEAGAPPGALVGQELPYKVAVRNAGPSTATGVVISTKLPADARFVGATPSHGRCERRGHQITCAIGDVAPGGAAGVTVAAVPSRPGPFATEVQATAGEADPRAEDNTMRRQFNVAPASDLRIDGGVVKKEVLVEQPLGWELRVRNAGPSAATGVRVKLEAPDHVLIRTMSATQGSCHRSFGGPVCALGRLADGGEVAIRVRAAPTAPGRTVLTARVTAKEADPKPADDVRRTHAEVEPAADLTVAAHGPRQLFVGGDPVYEIRVENRGPSPANRVEVMVRIPRELRFRARQSTTPDCTVIGVRVQCTVGTLERGATSTIKLPFRSSVAGKAALRVVASATESDAHTADNETTFVTRLVKGSSGSPNTLARGGAARSHP